MKYNVVYNVKEYYGNYVVVLSLDNVKKYDIFSKVTSSHFLFFREPVTFWITNPHTKMKNNVAAGGEVSGLVFVIRRLRTYPVSFLQFLYFYQKIDIHVLEYGFIC